MDSTMAERNGRGERPLWRRRRIVASLPSPALAPAAWSARPNRPVEPLRVVLDAPLGRPAERPVERYGPSALWRDPQDGEAADYCARALRLLLTACPHIDQVQFLMNPEAGIPEEEQRKFFEAQFSAIAGCGRPVRIDLRHKGLASETIEQAVKAGLDVTVSTKFWCEHMGLPYHPAAEDRLWRKDRYGYGTMLRSPRDYRIVYQLWTVGSQHVLLWGDPDYAARFARSCRLGAGEQSSTESLAADRHLAGLPVHDHRNWNATKKLLEIMEASRATNPRWIAGSHCSGTVARDDSVCRDLGKEVVCQSL
jgi:hypothetical protein